jgi:hypothetical protein
VADTSDIEAALVSLLVGAVYPNGTSSPSTINQTVSIERGWPTEAQIRNAGQQGIQLIRVHAVTGMSADNETFFRSWTDLPQPSPTMAAAAIAGSVDSGAWNNPAILAYNTIGGYGPLVLYSVTLSGSTTAGEIVAVNDAATHVVQTGDTLESVAASIAALIPGATSSGAIVFAPPSPPVSVGVYTPGTSTMEVGRVKQVFNISVWATSPLLRDQLLSSIVPALAFNYRLTAPDGSIATRIGKAITLSGPDDLPSRAESWKRDVRVMFSFPIIYSASNPPLAVGIVNKTLNQGA